MAFCRPRRPRRRRRSGRSPNLVCYGAEAVLEEVAFLSPCEDTLLKRGKNHAWKILGALLFWELSSTIVNHESALPLKAA